VRVPLLPVAPRLPLTAAQVTVGVRAVEQLSALPPASLAEAARATLELQEL
jgi:hypothetical protein